MVSVTLLCPAELGHVEVWGDLSGRRLDVYSRYPRTERGVASEHLGYRCIHRGKSNYRREKPSRGRVHETATQEKGSIFILSPCQPRFPEKAAFTICQVREPKPPSQVDNGLRHFSLPSPMLHLTLGRRWAENMKEEEETNLLPLLLEASGWSRRDFRISDLRQERFDVKLYLEFWLLIAQDIVKSGLKLCLWLKMTIGPLFTLLNRKDMRVAQIFAWDQLKITSY